MSRLPRPEMLHELGVPIAAGMNVQIFLPEQAQRHAAASEFVADVTPIRYRAHRDVGRRKQPLLQLDIRPAKHILVPQPGCAEPLQIIAHGTARQPAGTGNLPLAETELIPQTKNFSDPPHVRPRSGHPDPPWPVPSGDQYRCRTQVRTPAPPLLRLGEFTETAGQLNPSNL